MVADLVNGVEVVQHVSKMELKGVFTVSVAEVQNTTKLVVRIRFREIRTGYPRGTSGNQS